MERTEKILAAPDPHFQRYSNRPFPSYRYIEGITPHPTENKLGHSFGKEEEKPKPLSQTTWQTNEVYLWGIDLYNYAYWWEAHEAFEGLWKIESRETITSQYLQGLIKVCAALIKWNLKKSRGLVELYQGAVGHLQKVSERHANYMGVDLLSYFKNLDRHFAWVMTKSTQWSSPLESYPFIILDRKDKTIDLKK